MKVEYDPLNNVATVFPDGPLSKADFEDAAAQIDPAIEKHGLLNGLVIAMDSFPGWESFGSLVSHLRFVHDHHKAVARVALVTDSALGVVAEKLASHFVAAEIRQFAAGNRAAAQAWIVEK